MRAVGGVLLLAATAFGAGRADASPPPPPPAFMDDLARRLVATPTAAGFDAYAAAFATDLVVRRDGKPVAMGKEAWLSAERRRLGRVDRLVLTYAEGDDALLVVDRIDDRSGLPDTPGLIFDPRPATGAIRYAVGPDRLVRAIDIVRVDGFPRRP